MFLDFGTVLTTRHCWQTIFWCFGVRGGSESCNIVIQNWFLFKFQLKINNFSGFLIFSFCCTCNSSNLLKNEICSKVKKKKIKFHQNVKKTCLGIKNFMFFVKIYLIFNKTRKRRSRVLRKRLSRRKVRKVLR